jgi:hypothetical protein
MAESPIITCPECNKKFKGKGDLEGKKIKCPFCAKPFQVPAKDEKAAPAAAPAAAAASSGPAKPTTWDEDDENSDPYAVTTLDVRARCPNCANPMESEKAVVCLTCGYNTMTRQWGKTERVYSVTGNEHFMHLLPGLICALVIVIFVVLLFFFSLVLPPMVEKTWAQFLDHESMRLWISSSILTTCWALGMFCFKRLIINPKPAEEEKE